MWFGLWILLKRNPAPSRGVIALNRPVSVIINTMDTDTENTQNITKTVRLFKNRIISQGEKPASQFAVNPKNYRTHPEAQRLALTRILEKVGWVQSVIENKRTGYLIDGHERVWDALKHDDELVPYVQVDLAEEEETLVLAVFDRITEMAIPDRDRVQELLEEINTSGIIADIEADDPVQRVLDQMAQENKIGTIGGEVTNLENTSGELDGVLSLKEFLYFPSKLPYELPELKADPILADPFTKTEVWTGPRGVYDNPDKFLYIWGSDSVKGLDLTKTIIGFYTDDPRFESFWFDPPEYVGKLLNANILGAIMPNYSIWDNAPKAVKIWQRYRGLWVARYMQEAGIPILPDVQLNYNDGELPYMGIPEGVPFAFQAQQRGDGDLREVEFLDKVIDELKPPHVIIYADIKGYEFFSKNTRHARQNLLVWVKNRVSQRRPQMDAVKNEM